MARYSKKRGEIRPLSKRTTHTAARLAMRDQWWEPVKRQLQLHFLVPGAKRAMSRATGIADSQLHCYTCDDCEHGQEPTFSQGMQMIAYLTAHEWKAQAVPLSTPTPSDYRTANCLSLLHAIHNPTDTHKLGKSPNRLQPNRATSEI